MEARTHAVWGRWDERCIIGRHGAPSGCSGEQGGDGLILSYDRNDPTPRDASLLPRPQYPAWQSTTYKLLPVEGLLEQAANPAYSGDACESGNELYAVSNSRWNEYHYFGTALNGCSGDHGDMPWVWGRDVQYVLGHPCTPDPDDGTKRMLNVLTDAAAVFAALFSFVSIDEPRTSWENGIHQIPGGGQVQVTDGYQTNPFQSIDKNCCTLLADPHRCYDR